MPRDGHMKLFAHRVSHARADITGSVPAFWSRRFDADVKMLRVTAAMTSRFHIAMLAAWAFGGDAIRRAR